MNITNINSSKLFCLSKTYKAFKLYPIQYDDYNHCKSLYDNLKICKSYGCLNVINKYNKCMINHYGTL